jgi:hypothetical protein
MTAGRVLVEENTTGRPDIEDALLDTAASRFHPASVYGLVAGATGCFIFGLYLRAWLRERRPLPACRSAT